MGFNHRKLFLDSQSIEISEFCSFYCDSSKNKNGTCPELCIPRCRTTCLYSHKPTSSPPLPPADPPTPTPSHQISIHLYRIIPLCILAAIFLLFCCYTIYKSARRSSSSSQPQQEQETHDDFLDEDHGPVLDHPIWYIRTIGLNPLIINSIPVCKYKRSDGLVEGTECSVCLNEFQEDETLRLLPKCNHVFHIDCIDIWLRSHTNCPICRAGIVINPARLPTPSPEQSVENSVVWEDTQVMISEGGGETEVRSELQVESGENSHETAKEELVDEVRQMRRSVSVDSSPTSVIDAAMANPHSGESDGNSSSQLVKVKESNMGIVPNQVEVNQSLLTSMGDSSIGRSLQKGPILMKRSVSCNGLVLLSPHG